MDRKLGATLLAEGIATFPAFASSIVAGLRWCVVFAERSEA
ncbi:MAG TPA: hypothetical protein VMT36_09285 [Candidatus Saccharimonadia bacterium]|nr:hypothetical protein [Candidatus Saccharimonadia bacterium]